MTQRKNLIIGSGPAAAGAALALEKHDSEQVTVIDIGVELEDDTRYILNRLAATDREGWQDSDLAVISRQPVNRSSKSLPQKRSYGSDFPFRNEGQLDGVIARGNVNSSAISAAYGGFSNVWGAQIMPFSRGTFRSWPFEWREIEASYRSVLAEVPLAAEEDDLAGLFPLLGPAQKLPRLAERSEMILKRYSKHRAEVRSLGITVGRARLAFDSDNCVRCGLCMTGCPRSLIFSAARTFDRLRMVKRIVYRSGLRALKIGEDETGPFVTVEATNGGGGETLRADRLFVACGGLGTTRLVLESLDGAMRSVRLKESQQFVLPLMSTRATKVASNEGEFTLNQLNVLVDLNDDGVELCQIHLYPYNPAIRDALPRPLKTRSAEPLAQSLLRRASVGLGYLPSWASPEVEVRLINQSDPTRPAISLTECSGPPSNGSTYRRVLSKLMKVGRSLDLWPVLPFAYRSSPLHSYHFGGSFPHAEMYRRIQGATDSLGRLSRWQRVHLIDASVFPVIPATTFTLTVMANAHRIASAVARGSDA